MHRIQTCHFSRASGLRVATQNLPVSGTCTELCVSRPSSLHLRLNATSRTEGTLKALGTFSTRVCLFCCNPVDLKDACALRLQCSDAEGTNVRERWICYGSTRFHRVTEGDACGEDSRTDQIRICPCTCPRVASWTDPWKSLIPQDPLLDRPWPRPRRPRGAGASDTQ